MTFHTKTTILDKVARINFFDIKKNSLSSNHLKQLADTILSFNKNPNITIIILESEGNAVFCAGASFDELLTIENEEQGKHFFSGFAEVILAMRASNKIIIGNIQGKAVGGGVGLIAACDYAIATTNASVKLSELAIGIGPFVIEPAVSKKIGKTAMAELTLNPTEWKDAQWALNKGLYAKIFENEEEAENFLSDYALKLSQYNPEALLEMKQILWENTQNWDHLLFERAAISGKLVLSDFTKSTLKQFKKL